LFSEYILFPIFPFNYKNVIHHLVFSSKFLNICSIIDGKQNVLLKRRRGMGCGSVGQGGGWREEGRGIGGSEFEIDNNLLSF
jgi:hypothetical protein